ncbi:hypothetical protein M2324_000414 [Rhodovulum sulfidophilum]|nr:hypothetical protein [Rhodovulum sulfidophilum]
MSPFSILNALRMRLNWRAWAYPLTCAASRGPLAGIGLPEFQTAFAGRGKAFAACLVVEPGVRRGRDVLFHRRGIRRHAGQAAIVDHPGLSTDLDRLGEQPFGSLFPDPLPPADQRCRVDRGMVLK